MNILLRLVNVFNMANNTDRKRKETFLSEGCSESKKFREQSQVVHSDQSASDSSASVSEANNDEDYLPVGQTLTYELEPSCLSRLSYSSNKSDVVAGASNAQIEDTLEDSADNALDVGIGDTQEYSLPPGEVNGEIQIGNQFPNRNETKDVNSTDHNQENGHSDTQEYILVSQEVETGDSTQIGQNDTQEYSLELSKSESSQGNKKAAHRSISESGGSGKSLGSPIYIASSDEEDISTKVPLFKETSVQRDVEIISSIIPGVDLKTVYKKMMKNRFKNCRVDVVTNELLENGALDLPQQASETETVSSISSEEIFNEVADILIKFPAADPSAVYDMLEKHRDSPNRIELVLKQMSNICPISSSSESSLSGNSVKVTSSEKSTDLLNDPAFKSNPLYKDLKTLRKVMPDKDPNEIYAFLEAHFDKPNRVQIVIDELTKSESQESLPLTTDSSAENVDKGKAPLTAEDKLQADLKELTDIFRDCDPNFLYEKLSTMANDPERVTKLAATLFENSNYPKLKDILEKENKQKTKNKITKMKFNLKDFLNKFPDPLNYFADTDRLVNQNYKSHVEVYLRNCYPFLKVKYIKAVLNKTKFHLSPAVVEIDSTLENIMDGRSKKRLDMPREITEYPDDPEEIFFQEVLFCQNRNVIEDHLEEEKRQRALKVVTARENGELMECSCCFDDECLFEDMQACADGHLFCKECIRRSTVAAIGEGKTQFLCLTGVCQQQFPLTVLQEVLPGATFSLALCKMQEEELRQADIPDLVTCPFCSFATIMPDPEDKVFKCLNQDCLRESCRMCKEPNHVPLRCNEVEKQGETNMRTFIETKMTEAMLRTCPRCKKRFLKQDGCNKMTCTCGMTMCYVCRQAAIDYDHFNNGKCQIDSNIFDLHNQEMLAAAEKARQEYLQQHPEQSAELKYDPVKLLDKMKMRWEGNAGGNYYDNDDNEDYGDEVDYDDDEEEELYQGHYEPW